VQSFYGASWRAFVELIELAELTELRARLPLIFIP